MDPLSTFSFDVGLRGVFETLTPAECQYQSWRNNARFEAEQLAEWRSQPLWLRIWRRLRFEGPRDRYLITIFERA